MQKLSLRKQLTIVRLYLGGLSYDEIATRAGVSKGTVSNVIAELKAGQIPEAGDVAEQVDTLWELASDLRRCRLAPGALGARQFQYHSQVSKDSRRRAQKVVCEVVVAGKRVDFGC